jgi:hypothetical protein
VQANEGIEGRGATWYINNIAAALKNGNVTAAALYMSCFAHGMEDRSSPYHSFGGFEAERDALDAKYNITATCEAHPDHGSPCFVKFWAATDNGLDVSVPGYTPVLLGADVRCSLCSIRLHSKGCRMHFCTCAVPSRACCG